MSGQPYKTPIDVKKARQAYLANLNLRAELDDKNLQANKIYIKTGQLPSEPPDTRTLTEKLADIQRLKIELSSKLQEITDGENAQAIVNQLDDNSIQFLIQNWTPIKEQMKKMYSKGVLAPIFINYLQRYMDNYAQTLGIESGLQQSTGAQLLANQKIIMNTLASQPELNDVLKAINDLGINNSIMGRTILQNIEVIKNFENNLPMIFTNLNIESNAITKRQIIETLNDIVKDLPTKSDINTALAQLEQSVKASDIQGIQQVLDKIIEITTAGIEINEQITILNDLIRKQSSVPSKMPEGVPIEPTQEAYLTQGPQELGPPPVPTTAEPFIPKTSIAREPTRRETEIRNFYRNPTDPYFKSNKIRGDYIKQGATFLLQDEKGNTLNLLKDQNGNVYQLLSQMTKQLFDREPAHLSTSQYETVIDLINKGLKELVPSAGTGMKGKGIAIRIRPSQVFESDIDRTIGVEASPKFAPLGRHLINTRQLDKDIVAIKRPAGSIIKTLPSQRVSKNLGNVIRKIVGNGIPSYDDINSLTEDEKYFLYKVANETKINDKLNIPTPNKDEQEKDINQFEILKGQILAGNDNPELVKKFKTLILKLANKDLIPRGQVKELLLDLATLGH